MDVAETLQAVDRIGQHTIGVERAARRERSARTQVATRGAQTSGRSPNRARSPGVRTVRSAAWEIPASRRPPETACVSEPS